jgi:hypothetical protein
VLLLKKGVFAFGAYFMSNDEFQVVCGNCGSLSVNIEHPLTAPPEALVGCGDCGVLKGTIGALRSLATNSGIQELPTIGTPGRLQSGSELVLLHKKLQSLRRAAV